VRQRGARISLHRHDAGTVLGLRRRPLPPEGVIGVLVPRPQHHHALPPQVAHHGDERLDPRRDGQPLPQGRNGDPRRQQRRPGVPRVVGQPGAVHETRQPPALGERRVVYTGLQLGEHLGEQVDGHPLPAARVHEPNADLGLGAAAVDGVQDDPEALQDGVAGAVRGAAAVETASAGPHRKYGSYEVKASGKKSFLQSNKKQSE